MYSLPSGGQERDTQGQGYNAIPASFAIGSAQSTKLMGVSQTNPKADSESGTRSDLWRPQEARPTRG